MTEDWVALHFFLPDNVLCYYKGLLLLHNPYSGLSHLSAAYAFPRPLSETILGVNESQRQCSLWRGSIALLNILSGHVGKIQLMVF